ncbi:MAG: MBL fold metallo-hydrolase [Deltaproteobacteria bacterium]|nr:MBL fold metallo-hydrolase [Deltaproteobacteria bacterium]
MNRLTPIALCAMLTLSTQACADGEARQTSSASIEQMSRDKLHHGKDGAFVNPWGNGGARGFFDLLKWRFSKNPYAEEKKKPVRFNVSVPDFARLEADGGNYAVWLGHSTVLIKINGKRILTDPVFGGINLLLKRKTRFPIAPEKLPAIDFVLISHGHYDHLNTASVKTLAELFNPWFITGPGYDAYFGPITDRHITLDWWETHEADGVRITSLPVQHWSKRGLFDTNAMLWAGFMVDGNGERYFWAGDTGYYRGFKEIGDKFGPFSAVFLPIGSYEPRWFMKENHLNPEEALQAAVDLKAKTFIPIHWGTFDLTDEPLELPIKRLKEVYGGTKEPGLMILEHGGTWRPDGRP